MVTIPGWSRRQAEALWVGAGFPVEITWGWEVLLAFSLQPFLQGLFVLFCQGLQAFLFKNTVQMLKNTQMLLNQGRVGSPLSTPCLLGALWILPILKASGV